VHATQTTVAVPAGRRPDVDVHIDSIAYVVYQPITASRPKFGAKGILFAELRESVSQTRFDLHASVLVTFACCNRYFIEQGHQFYIALRCRHSKGPGRPERNQASCQRAADGLTRACAQRPRSIAVRMGFDRTAEHCSNEGASSESSFTVQHSRHDIANRARASTAHQSPDHSSVSSETTNAIVGKLEQPSPCEGDYPALHLACAPGANVQPRSSSRLRKRNRADQEDSGEIQQHSTPQHQPVVDNTRCLHSWTAHLSHLTPNEWPAGPAGRSPKWQQAMLASDQAAEAVAVAQRKVRRTCQPVQSIMRQARNMCSHYLVEPLSACRLRQTRL